MTSRSDITTRSRLTRPKPGIAEADASLFDSIVVPRWSSLFGRMIVREVVQGTRCTILDVGCGTGTPSFELLRKIDAGGRVIAIDRNAAFIDVARRKAIEDAGKRIFFKSESIEELRFGNEVFDLVVGNLVLPQLESQSAALLEMKRVLVRGGRLLLTAPLRGTFEEIFDMFREIAVKYDRPKVAERADDIESRYLTPLAFDTLVRNAGYDDVVVKQEELRLTYRSARDIFDDALIRAIALAEWRWIAGLEPGGEQTIPQVIRALDTYLAGAPVTLTVHAGLVAGRRPA